MDVVFLDYDGVVNTPLWYQKDGQWKCRFGQPYDGRVNNEQAVQWVSEFCQKYGYGIVVSSTWRMDQDYDVMLIRGGLRRGIEIVGKTPVLDGKDRGDEISQYLAENPDVTGYLIFDDDDDMGVHLERLVRCNPSKGFGMDEFRYAETLHFAFNNNEGGKENVC